MPSVRCWDDTGKVFGAGVAGNTVQQVTLTCGEYGLTRIRVPRRDGAEAMRSRTELRGLGGDDGFRLVELIIAILIIGVITVPLGDVVFGFLRNADETTGALTAEDHR